MRGGHDLILIGEKPWDSVVELEQDENLGHCWLRGEKIITVVGRARNMFRNKKKKKNWCEKIDGKKAAK